MTNNITTNGNNNTGLNIPNELDNGTDIGPLVGVLSATTLTTSSGTSTNDNYLFSVNINGSDYKIAMVFVTDSMGNTHLGDDDETGDYDIGTYDIYFAPSYAHLVYVIENQIITYKGMWDRDDDEIEFYSPVSEADGGYDDDLGECKIENDKMTEYKSDSPNDYYIVPFTTHNNFDMIYYVYLGGVGYQLCLEEDDFVNGEIKYDVYLADAYANLSDLDSSDNTYHALTPDNLTFTVYNSGVVYSTFVIKDNTDNVIESFTDNSLTNTSVVWAVTAGGDSGTVSKSKLNSTSLDFTSQGITIAKITASADGWVSKLTISTELNPNYDDAIEMNVQESQISAKTINQTSDRRKKDNIDDIENGLEIVSKVQPVTYSFKGNQRKEYGVIAQDLQEIAELKDLVYENSEGVLSVNYIGMIGIMLKSIQELQQKVVVLEQGNIKGCCDDSNCCCDGCKCCNQ
jgi:hypothetical protein